MKIGEVDSELRKRGHNLRCLRERGGRLEVVMRHRDAETREAEKDTQKDAAEASELAAAQAEAEALWVSPGPMSYLEALGRVAMGERSAEARNVIAAEVARLAADRA